MEVLQKLEQEAYEAACEILEIAKLKKGNRWTTRFVR